MVDGYRKQDFVVAGAADSKGLGIMLYSLKANWVGARPVVTTDGFMLSYSRSRVSYQTPDGDTMSLDERATLSSLLGMNLPILSSIGLKLDFYNAFVVLNQSPSGVGNKRFIQSVNEPADATDAGQDETQQPSFPANYPPSILDADANTLNGLNLTGLGLSQETVQ
jgi:hypothetical protein